MIDGQGDLLNYLPLDGVSKILDVGPGQGEVSQWFINRGLEVIAVGLDRESYKPEAEFLEASAEFMLGELYQHTGTFDAVWCAHVLEHCMNPGMVLSNIWHSLKQRGWLYLTVPPFKAEVVGGHVMTGWTIGQLMYVLILAGFDVKNGHFVRHGYNLAAFVRKSDFELPALKYDYGDIDLLKDHWPDDPMFKHGFNGNMVKWNWPP